MIEPRAVLKIDCHSACIACCPRKLNFHCCCCHAQTDNIEPPEVVVQAHDIAQKNFENQKKKSLSLR